MGVVADFAALPASRWPSALAAVAAAGVDLAGPVEDRGLRWYTCRRGRCSVELAFGAVTPEGTAGVCLSSGAAAWWRRPLGMRRLSQSVCLAVLAAGGRPA